MKSNIRDNNSDMIALLPFTTNVSPARINKQKPTPFTWINPMGIIDRKIGAKQSNSRILPKRCAVTENAKLQLDLNLLPNEDHSSCDNPQMKTKKNIGLIDADLLDGGTRHPNLALMKISGYHKALKDNTTLLLDYKDIATFDIVYLSKVFTATNIPLKGFDAGKEVTNKSLKKNYPNLKIGGTGFFGDKAPNLPEKIEHHMPDYHLYDVYVAREIARGIKPKKFSDYQFYSIGFATRGCFRKCDFCVNKKYDRVVRHSKITEFFDPNRRNIYLWDDNIFGYSKWKEVFDELANTGRGFQFRQGLDIRLLTEEKATVLANSKYSGDFIFAFDHLKDRPLIERNLKIWKQHCLAGTTKLYVLCAFESQDEKDIQGVFERIKILMGYRCLPYIMRYNSYLNSKYKGIYITLARWCNQPNFFKKKSFREFCIANGKNSSASRYMHEFETAHPEIAKKYFDLKFEKVRKLF